MIARNVEEVEAYLRSIPADATEARRWRAVTTATRALLRAYGVPAVASWRILPLPPQAHTRYGDCAHLTRTIRYRRQHVREWWIVTLSATIAHEAAHAITAHELALQGKRGDGGHGPMWRGVAAALGLNRAQAHNLPATPDKLVS